MIAVLLCLSPVMLHALQICTGVCSVGLLSKLQGCMRSKSERKVDVGHVIFRDIELDVV